MTRGIYVKIGLAAVAVVTLAIAFIDVGIGLTAPAPPYPTVIFSDGFESGNLGNWSYTNANGVITNPPPVLGTGAVQVAPTAAQTGTNGMRITNSAGQYALAVKILASPVVASSVKFSVRIANPVGLEFVAQTRDINSNITQWALYYDAGTHGFYLDVFRAGAGGTELYTGANSAPAGAWQNIEIQYDATATGGAQLYINGVTQPDWGVSGNYVTTSNMQRLQLWNDSTSTTDFDNVSISTPGGGGGSPTAPAAPSAVSGTGLNGGASLAWTAPLSDGGSPITGYRVTPSVNGVAQAAQLTGSAAPNATVDGLTNGTAYTFTVAAINAVGTGPESAASAAVTPAQLNAIQAENRLPGDPNWGDFTEPPTPAAISGYASQISVNHGQSLDLMVTTTAASVAIDVFRMGWYNGAGARLMQSLGSFPGVNQQQALPNAATGMVVESWSRTTTLNVPASWTSGVYLIRLKATNGYGSFIFFVVRNDGGHEAVAFQTSTNTYQAYNPYGGTSLYNNNTDKSVFPYPHALKVSYDRPFQSGNGAGQFLWYEFPFVRWMEKNGYDTSYTTDVDTSRTASSVTNHQAFLVVGHDEYWTKAMRNNVEGGIAAGVNTAFFGANESYWQVRFEPNAAGVDSRVMVGYKDFADCACNGGPDPVWNVDNSSLTSLWRDPQVNRPETQLMGNMFNGEVFDANYVVQNASHWIYAGTGWSNGTVVPGLVGYEYNHYYGAANAPAGTTVLSNSPVTNADNGQADTASAVTYTAPSGARVFSAGTIQWSYGLDNYGGTTIVNAGVQRATANILANFTSGPGGPTANPPGAPSGVAGTSGNGQVALSWTAPASDGGSPITGYRITPYVGATPQTAVVTGSTATAFTVTGLTNGTAYTFLVAAANAVGVGVDSAASAALTPVLPAGAPGAPSGVAGAPGNGQVALTWTAPASDGGSAITGYRVTPSVGGVPQAAVLSGSTATAFTVTGLTNGTAYTFTVAALNGVGAGNDSAPSVAVTPVSVPGAPAGVVGTAGDTQVALTWNAPGSDGGSPITGYRVTPLIGAVPQAAILTGSATRSFAVTGLQNGIAYTFTVAAINASGTGADSPASAAVTPTVPPAVPGAPSGVAGTPGNASVALTWTAPASDGGSAITGYSVTRYVGGTAQGTTATGSVATVYTVPGLTNGTAYTFTVVATNVAGAGAGSAPSAALTPATVPGAPTGVAGTAGNVSTVALAWAAPASNGGSAITGYRITPYIAGVAQTAQLTGSAATAFTVSGLTHNTGYTFRVAAINAAGTGAISGASGTLTPAVRLIQVVSRALAVSSTPSSAFAANVAAGNTLIGVFAAGGAGGVTIRSVTDTLGDTWVKAIGNNADTVRDDVEIWRTTALAGGANTVTLHLSSGTVVANMTIAEFYGRSAFAAGAGAASNNVTSHSSGNTVATAAGDFVIGGYVDRGGNTTVSISDGKTRLGSVIRSTGTETNQVYQLNAAVGVRSALFTSSARTTASVVVAAFTPQ